MAWQTPKTNWQENNALTPTDFNRIEGNIQHLQDTKETPAGAQAKVNTHAGSKQTHGISSGYYIAKTSRSDQLPAWNDIQGKPSTYPASPHSHQGSEITSAVANATNADKVDNYHIEDIQNDAQTRVNNHASSKQTHGISSGYYIAKTSRSDQLPAWGDIQGKPDLALSADLAAHQAVTASINAIGHVYAAEFTATLSTSWSGSAAPYTQTVTINGITSAHNPIIDVVMSGTYSTDQQRSEQWGYIYRAVTGANQITFYASEKPTVSLPIRVKVVR